MHTLFDEILSLPLYHNDGDSIQKTNEKQKLSLINFQKKVDTGEYTFLDNPCICNPERAVDVVLSKKDRYGISIDFVLCKNCGLIRQTKILNEKSLSMFYEHDYRNIYIGKEKIPEKIYLSQISRGKSILSLFSNLVNIDKIQTVFEVGCSTGGILSVFKEKNKDVSGCDYDKKYLEYGQQKGLKLYHGNINNAFKEINWDTGCDLIVLSHVLEHLSSPLNSLRNIVSHIKNEGYLIIEVPGTFTMSRPIDYFHIAHPFQFYGLYIKEIIKKLNLSVVYCDEKSTIIAHKKPNKPIKLNNKLNLEKQSNEVIKHIKRSYIKNETLDYISIEKLVVKSQEMDIKTQLRELSSYKSQFAKIHQFDFSVFEPLPYISLSISDYLSQNQREKLIELSIEIYKKSHKNKLYSICKNKKLTRNNEIKSLSQLLNQYIKHISDIVEILPVKLSIFECRIIACISLAINNYLFYKTFMTALAKYHLSKTSSICTNKESKTLNLLNHGEIIKYRQECKAFNNYHLGLGSKIEGKSIAIVGPAYPQKKQGEEIDSFDIVIRFNFTEKINDSLYFGNKTNASFYLGEALAKAKNNNTLSVLDFFVYQKTDIDFNIENIQNIGFERFQAGVGNQPLIAGGANALQRALIILLMYNPKKIKAFNMNMWLNNKFEASYKSRHASRDINRYLTDFVWHDPAGNFLFTQNLLNHNLFEADDDLKEVLALTLPEYLEQLGKSIGALP